MGFRYRSGAFCAALTAMLGLVACGDEGGEEQAAARSDAVMATALASGAATLDSARLEAGRFDESWRRYAEADRRDAASGGGGTGGDSTRAAGDSGSAARDTTWSESWEDISAETVNQPLTELPIGGDVAGPSIVRIQALLDLARFSPGIIDGRWGKNTAKAVYWFQRSNGLQATGRVDRATVDRLRQAAAGAEGAVVRTHTLTEQEVAGPFPDLPEDVYERAEMDCLCYESLREQLGEVFHSDPALLEQLNPGVDLNAVAAGDRLNVPAVEPFRRWELPDGQYTGGGDVARIVISDGGHYVHALDAGGRILYHFPSTLGSDYAPSPEGQFTITSIIFDPTWHYQPELLTGVDPSREDAVLPPGPNNAVGIVWMQLSKDHYGVHGTSAPETIGYVTSHGCVRLTNWDAARLGRSTPAGTPVEFRDVTGRASD